MTYEEAKENKKKWVKAVIIRCKKCGEHGLCIYADKRSDAWFAFSGDIAWRGTRPGPVCGKCGGDFMWIE